MTFRYTCGKLYSIKDYGSGKWSEVQVVVAPNVQIALTQFSSPLEAERRKKLQYKMNRVSIDAECRRINADKEYKRKIAQALEEDWKIKFLDTFLQSICRRIAILNIIRNKKAVIRKL